MLVAVNLQDRQVVGEDELIFLDIGVRCFLEMQAVIILMEVQCWMQEQRHYLLEDHRIMRLVEEQY